MTPIRFAVEFAAGLMFAAGLVISGMARPEKVVGFLDLTGRWDPTLMFVMAGAMGVALVAWRLASRMARPLLAETFSVPPKRAVDGRLVAGAAVFGLGWGLAGYCPGPAVVGVGAGGRAALVLAAGMIAGMLLFKAWERMRSAPAPSAGEPTAGSSRA